jgi:hypothetical protein
MRISREFFRENRLCMIALLCLCAVPLFPEYCAPFWVIGALVCAVVWAIIYVLGYYGVFTGSDLFAGETSLSKGLLDVCNVYLRPYLERFSEIAPNWFAKIPF